MSLGLLSAVGLKLAFVFGVAAFGGDASAMDTDLVAAGSPATDDNDDGWIWVYLESNKDGTEFYFTAFEDTNGNGRLDKDDVAYGDQLALTLNNREVASMSSSAFDGEVGDAKKDLRP